MNLRKVRKAKGLTLATVAQKVGVSIAYLSDIERGNRKGSPATIQRINEALNAPNEGA